MNRNSERIKNKTGFLTRAAKQMQYEESGVIVVDKPRDMTSAKVVTILKTLLKAQKIGHAGTLDPAATGVLICCVNRATRLARFFLQGTKKYEAVLCLGVKTDTQDATGKIIATADGTNCSQMAIETAFNQFKGAQKQMPPVYSALKHQGVSLYKLARRGVPVQKPARRIFISEIKILEVALPEIQFVVECSAGTYIRTLCDNIGDNLGCGGHLKALKRIESSGFGIHEALTLPLIEELAFKGQLTDRIIKMADALKQIPRYVADHVVTNKVRHGRLLQKSDLNWDRSQIEANWINEFIKVVTPQNDLLAVVKYSPKKERFSYCCSFPNHN